METVEQFNEDFNAKKPKKKGLLIGGIVAAVIVVALVLVYFLVLNNPKFIFGKAIDKLIVVDTQSYESVKIDTKIKADVELEDTTYQAQLAEVEKYTVKLGTQMDAEEKKQIVNLGLAYDNQAVVDADIYYNDGEMYAYLEGIFDKYIELDMDEESKAVLDEMFETITSEENLKNTEKVVEILKDEFKVQIKENGKFDKKKDEIEIGENEVKATKSTVTISEKQLYKIVGNMFSNLAKNDDFIDCFENVEDYTGESIKDILKQAAEDMKDMDGSSNNNIKISLYTKGLLNNNLVAVTVEIYSEDDESTIVAKIVKEDKDAYVYNFAIKANGVKRELVKGKVEIQKEKDSKKEQSGKTTITAEVIGLGSGKLEIDYSAEYNQGIDKIDTSNSVNMNSLTDADMQSMMTKLMERPLIKGLLENQMSNLGEENTIVETPTIETPTVENPIIDNSTATQTQTTTTQNEVRDYGYSVKYTVPTGFVYSQYSYDDMKFYDLENPDYSYIDATVSLAWNTETEYIEDEINWDYEYHSKNESGTYSNVKISEVKTIVVGEKTFKYKILSYDTEYGTKCQDVYVWYVLDNEYLFTVELEASDVTITEDIIKGFLNINVSKTN